MGRAVRDYWHFPSSLLQSKGSTFTSTAVRRLLLLAVLCVTTVLALAPVAGATSSAYASCAEIPTQEEAQNTLDSPPT
jgi:hypothetical protein